MIILLSVNYGGTQLVAKHPELFLPTNPADTGDNVIYYSDYDKPEAVEYMTDMIIGFLEDMGTEFYRQDYNFDSAEGWNHKGRQMDENGNRVGVSEIQYVTGQYQFLDNITADGYQIDNCVSGGNIGLFPDIVLANKLTDELLYNHEYMLHDFYILTQGYGRETNTKNAGYEFHIPEQGRGYLVCFRPSESDTEYTMFRLKGLEPEATYVVRNADNGETVEFTGEQLMTTGLKVQFPRVMVPHMIYFDKK